MVQQDSSSPPVKFNEPTILLNEEKMSLDLDLKNILDPKLLNFEEKLKRMGKKALIEPGSYSIIKEFNEAEAAQLGTISSGADSDDGWVVTILGVCCILAALSFFIWCVLYIMDYTSNDEMLENEKDDDDETVENEQELEYDDEIEDEEGFDDEELFEEEEVVIDTAEGAEVL